MLRSKCARMRCSSCASSSTSLWLRPPAGSSSSSSFGPPISARASSTRFCVPNGRLPAGVSATASRSSRSQQVVQPRDGLGVLLPHHRQAQRIGDEAGAPEMMRADQDVVAHAHAAEQRDVLEGAADAEAGHAVAAEALERAALEQDVAVGVAVDAADAVEQRGLAGAVRSDQAADLAIADIERHAAERDTPPKRMATLDTRSRGVSTDPGGIRSRAWPVGQSCRRRDGFPYVTPCWLARAAGGFAAN